MADLYKGNYRDVTTAGEVWYQFNDLFSITLIKSRVCDDAAYKRLDREKILCKHGDRNVTTFNARKLSALIKF